MRSEFASRLRCTACGSDGTLKLGVDAEDAREVREGALRCDTCGAEFRVRRGVAELLRDPPEHIVREAAGLERFAEYMRDAGWDRQTVLKLPYLDDGYWYVQARSMYQLLSTIPFYPGQSILDVGSNTCWAANHFAQRGLHAIALDISTAELQGLHTADYFLQDQDVFFERVLGSMDAIPLASSSLDYAYCCEVLHHNDAASLRRTFQEIFRVLRPGGRLLMVNETLKTLRDPHGVHTQGVDEFEGYEHAHWALRYRFEAARAGFLTEVTEPHYRAFFGDAELAPQPDATASRAALARLGFSMRRHNLARRAYLAWLDHVWGGVSMNMVATKPHRYVGRHEGIGALERGLRTTLAGARNAAARLSGRAEPRLPRTPEQAAEALERARASGQRDRVG